MSVRTCCRKCGSPIRFNRIVDGMGNKLNTLNCWNGHYEKIDLEFLEVIEPRREFTRSEIREILPLIKFVRLELSGG